MSAAIFTLPTSIELRQQIYRQTGFKAKNIMPFMKAMQIAAPGAEFELVQKEIPEPGKTEVRIKVELCGICHGDAVVKEGRFPGISYPRVPGHEVVGKIDKLGAKVNDWKTGQRVGVGWYGGPFLKCAACKRGDFSNCESFLTTGISFDDGYAEYMTSPLRACEKIIVNLKKSQ